ncbi:c-type cytochrome [Cohnella nanjingensis]|uniref:Cytochrome c n=1 Tax=Cohnella nanjingensis TaxID=1387779 RepID=A0A7X0RY43_9BACL|nr:cytochrome c [Cohnella nanjingensis]MBB6674490.1 cytochrome c [Cohnella nanjingensis]
MRKWIMPGLLTVCCLFAVMLMFYSLRKGETPSVPHEQAPSATASGEAAPAVGAEAATAVYKSNCLSCHGDQLQGAMGPALTKVGSTLSEDDIRKQITNGGGGMPAFKGTLTDEQVNAVASWLAAKK